MYWHVFVLECVITIPFKKSNLFKVFLFLFAFFDGPLHAFSHPALSKLLNIDRSPHGIPLLAQLVRLATCLKRVRLLYYHVKYKHPLSILLHNYYKTLMV